MSSLSRGANQHLIDGAIAERLNLKVVDPRNTSLNVVGGGRIWTEYGLYAVRLGPTPKGKFHELRCQGINRITSSYPKYDLGPINKSVLKTGKIRHVSLPEYIGGSQVRLLIGIKDTAIDPINLFTLPCGLGVYKSQFKDKFKSRICYGGPSHLFSKVNREVNGTSQSFSIFFSQIASSYRNSLYPALARLPLDLEDDADLPISYPKESRNIYKIPACHELNISVHPSPVTAQDIKIFNSQYILKDESVEEAPSMSLNPPREIFDDSVGVHFCSVYKAKVPLSKLIRVIDEDDISSLVNYRCPSCSKCLKCLQSNRTKTMSLQEAAEQELIARSVTIDTDQKKVFVEFPFLKDPVAFLQTFHQDSTNNRYQALRAYQAQCRKPQRVKEGIKKAHRELVDRGFMVKLTSLTQEQQELIKNSGFQHYFPWSSVEKESVSTPVRLVVDPSRTGLNVILAKGENNMCKIYSILIRNRCQSHIFTTDISKLYNQLHLRDSALPYSLFLFSEELDANNQPDTWVLVRAWYGVRSTGNQSGEALDSLAVKSGSDLPTGKTALIEDRYVDDVLSGCNSDEGRDSQISEVKRILSMGGFDLKYVAKS